MPTTRSTKANRRGRSGHTSGGTRHSPSPPEQDESDHRPASDDLEDEISPEDNPPRKRRQVREKSKFQPPNEKEKIKYLHWQLRKTCREICDKEHETFEDEPMLHVVLGEDWQYSYDHSITDESAINKSFRLDAQLLQDIYLHVYHNCVVTSTGQRFKDLLRSQHLDDESQSKNLEQMCQAGYTKPDRVGGKIKMTQYKRLCELYRKLSVEQFKNMVTKCFKDFLHFEHGKKQGAVGVVQNPAEKLSDTSKYSEQWKWLLTCTMEKGRPVPVNPTATIHQHGSDLEIAQIAASVKAYVAKQAPTQGVKISELWNEIVKTTLDITPREMITDDVEATLRNDAEEDFDNKLMLDLYNPRAKNPKWFPTPEEKKAHKVQYNMEHERTETVEAAFNETLNLKVLEAKSMLEDNLAHIGQTLLLALKKGIDGHPMLTFSQPGELTHTIVPRKSIQLEKDVSNHEDD